MTSYFKASLWLFAAVPGVPMRHLAEESGDGTGKQRILDADEVEVLASSAGCQEHVEVRRSLPGGLSYTSISHPFADGRQNSRNHP